MRTFGFGAEPTMALSWPRVMESRPTPCWALGGLTSRALEKNEDICDSTMLAVDERLSRECDQEFVLGRESDACGVT